MAATRASHDHRGPACRRWRGEARRCVESEGQQAKLLSGGYLGHGGAGLRATALADPRRENECAGVQLSRPGWRPRGETLRLPVHNMDRFRWAAPRVCIGAALTVHGPTMSLFVLVNFHSEESACALLESRKLRRAACLPCLSSRQRQRSCCSPALG